MAPGDFYAVRDDGKERGPLPKRDAIVAAAEYAGHNGKATVEVEREDGSRATYKTFDRT